MGSPHVQAGHTGINTLGTGASTRFPRSRSQLQGQRSQDQNSMPMHIYTSWVVDMKKLTTLAAKPWEQERPQDFQGQGHGPKIKRHGTQIPCPCPSTPPGSHICTTWPHWHQYLGHRHVTEIATFKVIALRSKVTKPQFHARAHLHLMGSPQTQFG